MEPKNLLIVLIVLIVLFGLGVSVDSPPANPVPLPMPTLAAHHASEIEFSAIPPAGGWCQVLSRPVIPAMIRQRIDVEDSRAVVWFILFANEGLDDICAMEFGFGDYDGRAFSIQHHGPCYPGNGLDLPSANWPGPNAGTRLAITDSPWQGEWVPIYHFAGYVYAEPGPTLIPFDVNPETGFATVTHCGQEPEALDEYDLGGLGVNTDWAPPLPLSSACCHGGGCSLESQSACDSLHGEWIPWALSCDPDPCEPLVHACCVGALCYAVTGPECAALGGISHWGTPGCDSLICTTPVQRVTWGQIKALYSEDPAPAR